MPRFSTQYKYPVYSGRIFCKPSLTDQSYRQECDIGFMIENYKVNKIPLPTVSVQYGNSPSADDFMKANEMVAELKTQFESLPSSERDRFGTVQNYLQFIGNPANLKESYEKGLIDPNSVDLRDVYPERFKVQDTIPTEPTSPSVTLPTQPTNVVEQ